MYSTALQIRHTTVMFVLRLQRLRAHLVLAAPDNTEDVRAVRLQRHLAVNGYHTQPLCGPLVSPTSSAVTSTSVISLITKSMEDEGQLKIPSTAAE